MHDWNKGEAGSIFLAELDKGFLPSLLSDWISWLIAGLLQMQSESTLGRCAVQWPLMIAIWSSLNFWWMDRSDITSSWLIYKKVKSFCLLMSDISWLKPLAVLHLLPLGQINYVFLPSFWAIRFSPLGAWFLLCIIHYDIQTEGNFMPLSGK